MKKSIKFFSLLMLSLFILSACSDQKQSVFDSQLKIVNESIKTYNTNGYITDDKKLVAALDQLEGMTFSDQQEKQFDQTIKKLPQEYQDLTKKYFVQLAGETVQAKYFKLNNLDNEKFTLSLNAVTNPAIKSLTFKTWTVLGGQDDLATQTASYDSQKKQWTSTFVLRDGNWDGTILDMEADVTMTNGATGKLASTKAEVPYFSLLQLVDHRGNTEVAAENSLSAFVNTRHWGLETDIMLTKDRQWVVMHDDTVNRMTNGTGKVSDYTLAELEKLTVKDNKAGKNQEPVPTFEEYLQICKEEGIGPFIEIKTDKATAKDFDNLAAVVNKLNMTKKLQVISFYPDMLKEFVKKLPVTEAMMLVFNVSDQNFELSKSFGIYSGLNVNYTTITAAQVKKLHDAHLLVGVHTAPKSEWERLRKLGVDYITTDD